MASSLKTKIALTAGTALFGTLALSGTAQAEDRTLNLVYGGYLSAQAVTYGANGAVKVCDRHADGHSVAARYKRVSGYLDRQGDSNGVGTCTESVDIPSNPIRSVSLCINISGVDWCTDPPVLTGR